MKIPKSMLSPVDRQRAQYEAMLIGLTVRQALQEDRMIRTGQIPEPARIDLTELSDR